MQELQTDFPENHGLSSRSLLTFFARMEQLTLKVNSFVLLQDGKATAQFYRKPYRKGTPQLLFSLSKSFTSIAVGIAIDEGCLNLSDTVLSFFPDKQPDVISDNLSQMTVHHLLSMNAGHQENIYSDVVQEKDWVQAFLSAKVDHKPGTYYKYSTHSTYMLAAIVEKVTGQHLIDYLMPRLFEPLGISRPSWENCPMGIAAGGMGLSIPTEGVAKFGQMLLDKGLFNGQRIVSEAYIELAVSEQSDTSREEDRIDFSQGYGYQFFLCRDGCFMGNGGYGQFCFVAPRFNLVMAGTSDFSSMRQLQTLLDLVYEHILGHIDKECLLNLADQHSLQKVLSGMTYSFAKSHTKASKIMPFEELRYISQEDSQPISQLHFSSKDDLLGLRILYRDHTEKVYKCEIDGLVTSRELFVKDLAHHEQEVVTHACWKDVGLLVITRLYIETPYVVKYAIAFTENRVELHCISNVIADYRWIGRLN